MISLKLLFLLPLLGPLQGPAPVPPAPAPSPASLTAPAAEAPVVLRHATVIGASISAGFLLSTQLGAATSLADYLTGAIQAPHDPVRSFASGYMFMDPLGKGERQVESALKEHPSLLFAFDFLFWFGYGMHGSGRALTELERLALLEQGLALLERFECPLVLCDFPDMSPALAGEKFLGQRMIVEEQVPPRETLAKLNARLGAWAAEHKNAVLVPMAAFLDELRAGKPREVRGNLWDKDSLPRLQQKDLLHATNEGTAALVVLALDRLLAARADVPADALLLDASALAKRVWDVKEGERNKRKKLRDWPESKPAESRPAVGSGAGAGAGSSDKRDG